MSRRQFFEEDQAAGLPPGVTAFSRQQQEARERYFMLRWQLIRADGVMQRDTVFEGLIGTHFYVDSLHSQVPIAVRLGAKSNPFVPVEEGDVLTRPLFTGVTVRHLGPNNPAPGAGEPLINAQGNMRAYVSTGQLMTRDSRVRRGLRRGFQPVMVNLTTAATDVFGYMESVLYFDPTRDQCGAHLYRGGGFVVRNLSTVDVQMWWGQVGDPAMTFWDAAASGQVGWVILPGEVQTFDETDSMRTAKVILPVGAGTQTGRTCLLMSCKSGTAKVIFLLPQRPYSSAEVEFNIGMPLPELNP